MKLLQTVVSAEGFRNEASNRDRLGLLKELVRLCTREEARLLLVPAGFLTAPSEDDVPALIGEVNRLATADRVAVIGGVDVEGRISKQGVNINDLVSRSELPFLGFAVGPVALPVDSGHPWRQTSVSSNNADLVPNEAIPGQERVATIDGFRVGVLICGELFSWRARRGLAQAGVGLVADVGHVGMGQGLIPAMKNVAKEGQCCVAHSQHLSGWYGRALHFMDARGEQLSADVDQAHFVEHGSLWAAWAAREV
jgi:hypothetical protein